MYWIKSVCDWRVSSFGRGRQLLSLFNKPTDMSLDAISKDKNKEKQRYDNRAAKALSEEKCKTFENLGATGVPEVIRTPYLIYEKQIQNFSKKEVQILDLCCGCGVFSLVGGRGGASITVTDIALHNVELALLRGKHHGISLSGKVGDAEGLQFEDNSFDIVTCAGSLSYLDHRKVFTEIHRILKEEGVFICVDSLNHNPIYRFNRWIHYLLGDRTKSTLLRMPTMRVFDDFEREIGPVVCRSFHGIFSFLIPLLKPLLGASTTRRVLDYLDLSFPALRNQAFKFVAVVKKKSKTLQLKPS